MSPRRWVRNGVCSIEGCEKPHHGLGWCKLHYQRWCKHGDPLYTRPATAERFWVKVDREGPVYPRLGTRCWVWTGRKNHHGYGMIGRGTLAHRFSYEQASGMFWPWMARLQVDHRCHNRACVRPGHLRMVTFRLNQQNRRGPQRNNKSSGIRGVHPNHNRWMANVTHNGNTIYLGTFDTIAEAEAVAVAKRNEVFTHNDLDRAD